MWDRIGTPVHDNRALCREIGERLQFLLPADFKLSPELKEQLERLRAVG